MADSRDTPSAEGKANAIGWPDPVLPQERLDGVPRRLTSPFSRVAVMSGANPAPHRIIRDC